MKILFFYNGGLNGRTRALEFERMGHVVEKKVLLKPLSFMEARIAQFGAYFDSGPWIEKVNTFLLSTVMENDDADLIWIDKCMQARAETIEELRAYAKCPIVHYTPDFALANLARASRSKIFEKAVPAYDAVITTKDFEVSLYQSLGAKLTLFSEQAICHRRFYPRQNLPRELLTEVGFIGNSQPGYMRTLRSLSRAGVPLDVRGGGWDRYRRRFDPRNWAFNRGAPILGELYPQRLSGMKIGLCLLTKYAPEQVTTRSFEIPACGTFMLAERTQRHLEIFEEGVHADYFGSIEELIDKSKFYLRHDKEREAIAAAGRERFLECDGRLDLQMARIMTRLHVELGLRD